MKQQSKLHFLAFLVAALLAVGGLFAQVHSAYAIGNLPPAGPRLSGEDEPILLDWADWLQLQGMNPPARP